GEGAHRVVEPAQRRDRALAGEGRQRGDVEVLRDLTAVLQQEGVDVGPVALEHGGARLELVAGLLLLGGVELRSQAARLASVGQDRKSTRLNSSHVKISYAVFCLKQ